MNIDFLPEPELDFGVDKHVDIRFGIMNYGTVDFSSPLAPKEIRLGIVGTNESVEGICNWFEKCKGEIPAKESKQPNLFPKFPGFRPDIAFQSTITLNDRLHRVIKPQTFKDLSRTLSGNEFIASSVDLFFEEFKYLAENSKIDVFVCAVPQSLLEASESTDEDNNHSKRRSRIDFHDLLKAKSMSLNVPIQLVIPSTYDDTKRRKQKRKSDQVRKPQDEATRAWNFHTALYYKAKGIPWRLTRMPSDFTTCYVGISFYKTLDGSKLLTSVAQVFNERGEGVIVRGGQAQVLKDDRQVHLDQNASFDLLVSALNSYRTEHKNLPARIVIHKTSTYTPDELEGFIQASKSMRVDMVDLISTIHSSVRLFRTGSYPPLRGTFLSLDEINHILYTRGSVNFFETYPGMYIPRSLCFRTESTEQTAKFLAQEILSLTKMNWNQTQFDGGDPITIRAAREVSQILKYIPEDEDAKIAPSYRFYM
ncbi:MAG: hypothetical protein JNJ43_11230 [Anaerolineales bacterium]|nr:hypothetical protein [Anaerolineales bacterium]